MAKDCIFTIVDSRYLGFAKTLMDSVALHAPEVNRIVVLFDHPIRDDTLQFDVLSEENINIPNLGWMSKIYTKVELLTAIKPFVFKELFKRGFKNAVYFDPDILVFDDVSSVFKKLEKSNILITPHLVEPVTHDEHPTELEIIQSGSYNLGFLALSKSDTTAKFLDWWCSHLEFQCINSKSEGIFVDQKWIDLVPSLFHGVEIVRHPGWNVAYWNLHERNISQDNNCYLVNNERLLFFHFSGIRPLENMFSAHRNPFSDTALPDIPNRILRNYLSKLSENAASLSNKMAFKYQFIGNIEFPDLAKFTLRREFTGSGITHIQSVYTQPEALIELVNSGVILNGKEFGILTKLAYEGYLRDKRLQQMFPNVPFQNSHRYASWFILNAQRWFDLGEEFVQPQREALSKNRHGKPTTTRLKKLIYKVYDSSPVIRKTYRTLTNRATRQRIARLF